MMHPAELIKSFFASPSPKQDMARLSLNEMPAAVYAIGDVHGCYALLRLLEEKILQDAKNIHGEKLIVYLGDFVDRGDQVASVIDHLLSAAPEGFQRLCLCGNHEFLMRSFWEDPECNRDWLNVGGTETLRSYGVEVPRRLRNRDFRMALAAHIPQQHIAFLYQLPISLELPEYFLVHAGVDPDREIGDQVEQDMLWIRKRFTDSRKPLRKTVVYGHTPRKEIEFSHQKIGVDTGAYATGVLSAVRLQSNCLPVCLEVGHETSEEFS